MRVVHRLVDVARFAGRNAVAAVNPLRSSPMLRVNTVSSLRWRSATPRTTVVLTPGKKTALV